MSGEVRLSEADKDWLREITDTITAGLWTEEHDPLLFAAVEAILTARLAPVEALAETWEADPDGLPRADGCARQLRAALAPQPAPGESGGAS